MSGLLVTKEQQTEYATMAISDQFFKAEQFQKHTHQHSFEDGETLEQREAWLRHAEATCQAAQIKYIVRETLNDEGHPGYEFGFPDRISQIAFTLNMVGDMVGEHTYRHSLEGVSPEDKRTFFLAVEGHLAALSIQHYWEEKGDSLEFSFEKFSDQLMLEMLIGNGTIEISARSLKQLLLFRKVHGLDPVGPLGAPGLNL